MSVEPDYVVVRRGPDMPDEWLMPDGLEGRWFDRSTIRIAPDPGDLSQADVSISTAVAVPTGRFEVRESDGAVAEVWEIRPGYHG